MLSLLKFLQLPLFFKYLVDHLESRNKSVYSIKIIRVSGENFVKISFSTNFSSLAEHADTRFSLSLCRLRQFSNYARI
jgi:hypothetical protein